MRLNESNIYQVIPLYIEYYNDFEEGVWTADSAYKRILQVVTTNDSFCLILKDNEQIIGFSMGYFVQYDDIIGFDIVEIVIKKEFQRQGIGTTFMKEIEQRVKEKGALQIQLQAVNDDMHNNFYGKLGYKNATNFVFKAKML
ncbi:MAG: GNAT family N-acetyltransferase [Clostridiales bacterium]|nr:GNAT family N-acetyltransferase [Clostridiales bacterium]